MDIILNVLYYTDMVILNYDIKWMNVLCIHQEMRYAVIICLNSNYFDLVFVWHLN